MHALVRNSIFICLVAIHCSGCGGKYFRPYVQDQAAATLQTREESGLKLTVNPLLDEKTCQTYFGMDCPRKGILPVYLTVANTHADTSYRIVAADIWFGGGANDSLNVKSGIEQTNNVAAGSTLAVVGGALGSLFIVGAGMKATDDAESIRENFVIKQFQNVTLTPGKSAEGFVYYVRAPAISTDMLPSINIPVQNLSARQTNTLSFRLTSHP